MRAILINMEMPKQCGGCPLRSGCKQRIYIEYRPKDCPLIEVELVEDEEAIVPVNMIGGYLKREAEHEEMSDQ